VRIKNKLFLLILFAAYPLWAQKHNLTPKTWVKEPSSFLGIAFGKPIGQLIPECPRESPGSSLYSWWNLDHPCFEPVSDFYSVHNISQFTKVYVTEIDGNAEFVTAIFNTENAKEIGGAMIEKFGPPSFRKINMEQNRMGANFENLVMIWKGINIEIEFDSIGSRIDEGIIEARTKVYTDKKSKDKEISSERLKGIL
jgi:hypothetical protein